jgi:hypothetical protein
VSPVIENMEKTMFFVDLELGQMIGLQEAKATREVI